MRFLKMILGVCYMYFSFDQSAHSQTNNADVQNAQNQAAIATANATIATATATMTNAQATAQQALIASELANQKNEISNIQTALQAPDPSKLRSSGTLTAPTVNATYNRIYTKEIELWLNKDDSQTPVNDIASCKSVFISRPSLPASILAYKATSGKLEALLQQANLSQAQFKSFSESIGIPSKKAPGAQTEAAVLPVLTGINAIANIGLSIAAAAKPQTAIGTQQIGSASKIFTAAVFSRIAHLSKELYDPDVSVDVNYDMFSGAVACNKDSLIGRAGCVSEAIINARNEANAASVKMQNATRSSKDAATATALKAKFDALNTSLNDTSKDFSNLFIPEATTNVIPFNSAAQGEVYDVLLKDKDACIISLNAITSDADTIVRDGTFSSYKLSIATTTTVSWTVADPKGKIIKAGFKPITTDWDRQDLGH